MPFFCSYCFVPYRSSWKLSRNERSYYKQKLLGEISGSHGVKAISYGMFHL